MSTLWLLLISLITMFLLPIVTSALSNEHDEEILEINQDNTKDPRYFSNSFKRKFLTAYRQYEATGEFVMSRKEDLHVETVIHHSEALTSDKMLYLKENCTYAAHSTFNKEIYAERSICIGNNTTVRGIAAEEQVITGERLNVIRWIDGDQMVRIGDYSNLGQSVSSGELVVVGRQTSFRRLFAPRLFFGHDQEMRIHVELPSVIVNSNIVRDCHIILPDGDTNSYEFEGTIVTDKDVKVTNGMIIKGAISTQGNIMIESNCIVHGNMFAEKNIFIGKSSKIYGTIFSQENITLSDEVEVGVQGKIKSIVARETITIGTNVNVYGYISCEKGGKTL